MEGIWIDTRIEMPTKVGTYKVKTRLGTEDILDFRVGFTESDTGWWDMVYKDSQVRDDYVLQWLKK